MKKIVGIVTAAAIATSVFAADVSAATKIKGNLFNYGADETIQLFAQGNDSHDYANPNMTFSISDDKAGATIKLTTDGSTLNVAQTTQTIWFKPVDALKISVGSYDLALNKEKIDWTESVTGLGGNGYVASINASGFALDVFLNEGNNGAFWFKDAKSVKAAAADAAYTEAYNAYLNDKFPTDDNKAAAKAAAEAVKKAILEGKDPDPALAEFGVKASYGADFGTIGAFVDINRTGNRWTYHDNLVHIDYKKEGAIQNVLFGAGYANNFDGIDVFANVVGYMGEKFDWIRPEVYVSGSADAFGYSLFAAPVIWTNSDLKKDTECEVVAKVTYALDSITPYAYFKDNNVMAKDFAATIKLGATGSVGAMGWNAWLQLDVAKKTAVSVPFELTMSF